MVREYPHRLEKMESNAIAHRNIQIYSGEMNDLKKPRENLSYIEYLADYLTFADEEEGLGVVKSMKETGYLEDLKYLS
ncbi:MAG: hypothetical protein ACLTS1_08075 [Coprococcus sp.]